ncbi:MAG: hypothetical protein APF76_03390 [Desulfitibacter sp. BRH_c19]|nr:MAG: hypothetical protein APF76_03390 [Desulfitibacter sp. BRH_c19]
MRSITMILMVLVIAVFASGCGVVPDTPDAVKLYNKAGVDPNSWALVPTGEFLQGQFNKSTTIDYDYEIMVTNVTNYQYARYLEEVLAAGEIEIENGNIYGYYPGDEFEDGKHEEKIEEGYYLHMPLEDLATRITYDGTSFYVKDGYENHPVTMVSWFGAKAYADFFNYRLPTGLEWEKAARGTDDRPYPWGDELTKYNANYYHSGDPFETNNGYSDTTPVGFYNGQKYGDFQTFDSPSPYGLYDMAGNVADWTGEKHYKVHYRYMRGGNSGSYGIDTRIWKDNSSHPEYVSPSVGFRCIREPQ